MIKIAHEAPVSFMNKVRDITDYDYALACLFDKIPGYFEYFEEALKNGRHVLLDNGVFEDGVPMEAEQYAKWIEKLHPTEYIVPDEFDKMLVTIDHFWNWSKRFNDLPGGKIGVCQGTNFGELTRCYDYYNRNGASKIAVNFASVAFQDYAVQAYGEHVRGDHAILSGRPAFIHMLFNSYAFNPEMKHHLLGCVLPSEFTILQQHSFNNKRYLDYFETMDTSAPVVWGLLKGRYPTDLHIISSKIKTKLKDLITVEPTAEQREAIISNIMQFRAHLA